LHGDFPALGNMESLYTEVFYSTVLLTGETLLAVLDTSVVHHDRRVAVGFENS
jgi:hypothetical protein